MRQTSGEWVTWEAVSAIATLVGSAVVVVAAFFAVAQLREAKRATLAQALFIVFEEIASPVARDARTVVYGHPQLAEGSLPDAALARALDEALSPFDRLQAMIDLDLLPDKVVVELYGVMMVRLWRSAEPFVKAERTRRGPSYRGRTERLASTAERFHPDSDITPGVAISD